MKEYLDGMDYLYPDDTDWDELESSLHQAREQEWLDALEAGSGFLWEPTAVTR